MIKAILYILIFPFTIWAMEGLDLNKFKQEFNEDLRLSKSQQIYKLKEMGMIKIVDNKLKITDEHMYVSNSIIVELL